MSLDTKHPLYIEFEEDWTQLRDCYSGERAIKAKGFRYLPATSGMIEDGAATAVTTDGFSAYRAYRTRARFPEFVRDSVESMIGIMHAKPPVIELTPRLEALREKATMRGESLEMLLRRINEEQLTTGRLGLLLDVVKKARTPYISLYGAESPINWNEGTSTDGEQDELRMVVLDESEPELQSNFGWKKVDKYRVLLLGNLSVDLGGKPVYRVGVFRDGAVFDDLEMVEPEIRGAKLNTIPFVFINTKDVVSQPDDAPLLGLSNLALTVYRGEADYRQALFLQGQDTLVTIGAGGADAPLRAGGGASIDLPIGGDAKFIGVDSTGLSEMRSSLENDYERAEKKTTALFETVGRAESGEALRVRVAAKTASLNQIALAGAYGLQEVLRKGAIWMGENPDDVQVTPNTDFVSDLIPGREMVDYMSAKMLGAPISLRSIHAVAQDRGLTEMTFEDELKEISAETDLGLGADDMEGTRTGAPVTDDEDSD